MAEPPYGVLAERFAKGRVVPFLGAGASMVGRPPDARWDAAQPQYLPSGAELAGFLAHEASFPSKDPAECADLARVSSYYVDVAGREGLRGRLREVFNNQFVPGPLHELLAAVPAPLVIVVTNYDTLVEEAFRKADRPYDLVVYPADRTDFANATLYWPHGEAAPRIAPPNELDIDLAKRTVIFKMHGSVVANAPEWDSFVITEEDYIEFLARMTTSAAIPPLFLSHFRDRSFLFLGYGLRDWNLRVLLRKCFERRDPDAAPSWAIQRAPSELEQALWDGPSRKVKIYDVELATFAAKLRERMRA
jgi:hypothetical protein